MNKEILGTVGTITLNEFDFKNIYPINFQLFITNEDLIFCNLWGGLKDFGIMMITGYIPAGILMGLRTKKKLVQLSKLGPEALLVA